MSGPAMMPNQAKRVATMACHHTITTVSQGKVDERRLGDVQWGCIMGSCDSDSTTPELALLRVTLLRLKPRGCV